MWAPGMAEGMSCPMVLVGLDDIHQEAWTHSQDSREQGKFVGQGCPAPCKEDKWSFLSGLSTPGAVGFHMSLQTLEETEESILSARGEQTTSCGLFWYSPQTKNGFYIFKGLEKKQRKAYVFVKSHHLFCRLPLSGLGGLTST